MREKGRGLGGGEGKGVGGGGEKGRGGGEKGRVVVVVVGGGGGGGGRIGKGVGREKGRGWDSFREDFKQICLFPFSILSQIK